MICCRFTDCTKLSPNVLRLSDFKTSSHTFLHVQLQDIFSVDSDIFSG